MIAAIPGLHDIHLPPSPGWWPPAPGWWLLAAAVLGAIAWIARRRILVHHTRRAVPVPLDEFDSAIAAADSDPSRLAVASALLRRAAKIRHPEAAVLEGDAWMHFLDGTDPSRPFTQGAGTLLRDGAFRRQIDADVNLVLGLVRTRFVELVEQPGGTRNDA